MKKMFAILLAIVSFIEAFGIDFRYWLICLVIFCFSMIYIFKPQSPVIKYIVDIFSNTVSHIKKL